MNQLFYVKIQICEVLYIDNFDAIFQQWKVLKINNLEVISLMCTLPKSWDTFNTREPGMWARNLFA